MSKRNRAVTEKVIAKKVANFLRYNIGKGVISQLPTTEVAGLLGN